MLEHQRINAQDSEKSTRGALSRAALLAVSSLLLAACTNGRPRPFVHQDVVALGTDDNTMDVLFELPQVDGHCELKLDEHGLDNVIDTVHMNAGDTLTVWDTDSKSQRRLSGDVHSTWDLVKENQEGASAAPGGTFENSIDILTVPAGTAALFVDNDGTTYDDKLVLGVLCSESDMVTTA